MGWWIIVSFLSVFFTTALCTAQERDHVPKGGRSILAGPLARFAKGSENQKGSIHVVEVEGPGFTRALEVESKLCGYSWEYVVRWRVTSPLKKGDVLLVHLWARTLQTAEENGRSVVGARISVSGLRKLPKKKMRLLAPLTQGILVNAGEEWQHFFIRAQAPWGMPAKKVCVALSCSMQRQRVQFGGMDILNYGRQVKLEDLPMTRYIYEGREPDAPWRKAAEARIRQHRTREVKIVVRDANGEPVEGARVELELKRHAFGFGAAFSACKVLKEFNPDYEAYRKRILENFSSASFINALKWHSWAGDWGPRCCRKVALDALRWVAEQKLPFRGHCLVWPRKKSVSKALRKMLEADHPDSEAIQREILRHIQDVALATKFWMDEWDVLNESIPCHDVQDLCGDEVMVDWFKETRRLLPEVKLALNEYSILASLTDTRKVLAHEARIQYLLDRGAPVDVLGMQSHMDITPPSPLRVLKVLERFSKFNLPIRATEFTMNATDADLLYDYTRDFYTVMFSHPLVIGVQMWGFEQMYDEQGNLSPIGRAYRDLVFDKWHTKERGSTDAAGNFSCRGFLGTYTTTLSADGRKMEKTFQVPKGDGAYVERIDLK